MTEQKAYAFLLPFLSILNEVVYRLENDGSYHVASAVFLAAFVVVRCLRVPEAPRSSDDATRWE